MTLIRLILERPAQLSTASQFTVSNGVIYLVSGLLLLLFPDVVQILLFESEFVGREHSMTRLLGMMLAIVGWLYIFGGRSGGKQFVASTVVDRLIFVPLILLPFIFYGIFPRLLGVFAILDPLLALIAWYLLARAERDTNPVNAE